VDTDGGQIDARRRPTTTLTACCAYEEAAVRASGIFYSYESNQVVGSLFVSEDLVRCPTIL
jgi:hypothetical protein